MVFINITIRSLDYMAPCINPHLDNFEASIWLKINSVACVTCRDLSPYLICNT